MSMSVLAGRDGRWLGVFPFHSGRCFSVSWPSGTGRSTLKRGRLQGSGVSGVGFSKQRPGGRGGRGGRGRWPAHTPPAGVPRSVSDLLGLSF